MGSGTIHTWSALASILYGFIVSLAVNDMGNKSTILVILAVIGIIFMIESTIRLISLRGPEQIFDFLVVCVAVVFSFIPGRRAIAAVMLFRLVPLYTIFGIELKHEVEMRNGTAHRASRRPSHNFSGPQGVPLRPTELELEPLQELNQVPSPRSRGNDIAVALAIFEETKEKYPELVAQHGEISVAILRRMLGLPADERHNSDADERMSSAQNSAEDAAEPVASPEFRRELSRTESFREHGDTRSRADSLLRTRLDDVEDIEYYNHILKIGVVRKKLSKRSSFSFGHSSSAKFVDVRLVLTRSQVMWYGMDTTIPAFDVQTQQPVSKDITGKSLSRYNLVLCSPYRNRVGLDCTEYNESEDFQIAIWGNSEHLPKGRMHIATIVKLHVEKERRQLQLATPSLWVMPFEESVPLARMTCACPSVYDRIQRRDGARRLEATTDRCYRAPR